MRNLLMRLAHLFEIDSEKVIERERQRRNFLGRERDLKVRLAASGVFVDAAGRALEEDRDGKS